MNENLRENYFAAVRTLLLLIIMIYTIVSCSLFTGASVRVLLLLALFTGIMSFKELVSRRVQAGFLAAAVLLFVIIFKLIGNSSVLFGVFVGFEIVSFIKPALIWYLAPFSVLFFRNGDDLKELLVISMLLAVIYVQHDLIVETYKGQTKENILAEQSLKHDMDRKENRMKEQLRKSLLSAENQVLEERTQLSQTLHDKLGHNINGSVYQLEAVKLLMEKDPEKARAMVQAVIDQLRSGMDEIRAILRNKRPEKHRLAALQLEGLCEDCRSKGIEAELVTEGELSAVPENYLEMILDNCFEAVSNSMKYSHCTRICIHIYVLNKMVRCSVTDNGIGCDDIKDGMGLSGMRRRIRQAGGMIEISSDEQGFKVNMLLPM